MLMPIIGILLMLLLFGGMGGAVYYAIKKSDPNKTDTSVNDNAKTAQEFLPFQDIKDSMIDLGGHNYRAIIECNSINYYLRTEKEKEIIELGFQRFLNSLTFPITMYVQTRTIDNSAMLNSLQKDLENTVDDFPNLIEYANIYYQEISQLDERYENNKQKKKYIIIPYSEAINLEKLSDEEKYEYSIKELEQRCQILIDGLSAIGIKASILSTTKIIELLYSTYNKDNYSDISEILNGNYMSLMVKGENRLTSTTNEGKVDWILYEAENRLNSQIIQSNVPNDVKNEAIQIVKAIENLRNEHAGYYKTNNNDVEFLENVKDDKQKLNFNK